MSEDLAGVSDQLEHLLAEREANLALIEQRKAGYVLPTDIPLQMIADEKTLRTQRDRLLARLDAPDRVVLAVQAQGGMGKTALAQKLAHDLASRFPGGALWIELGPEAGQGTALER